MSSAAVATEAAMGGRGAEFQAAAGALAANSMDSAKAIRSVYGPDTKQAFLPLWRRHIGFAVVSTRGVLTHDRAKQNTAVAELVQYMQDFGAFLIAANPNLPKPVAADVVKTHVLTLVDSTVNNPNEAVGHWKAGRLRPLGIFDLERLELPDWQNIPTTKEQGYDIEYLMLRGIFGAPDIPKEAQEWYIELLKKISETPEWVEFTDKGGLKRNFLTGLELTIWLDLIDTIHKNLMTEGGLLKE